MNAPPESNGAGARPIDWQRTVADDVTLSTTAYALALHLARFAKGTGPHVGTLFASQADLMSRLKLKERRVRDLLHELEDHGYLEETRRGGYNRAAVYRLTMPPTGTQLPVREDSQPAAEPNPTGTQLPVDAEIQPALSDQPERNPTGTQGPPKREELSREKSQLAAAADRIADLFRLGHSDRLKVVAALKASPDPQATAREVTQEPLSKSARSSIAVALARIKAVQNGGSARPPGMSISGGAPSPPEAFEGPAAQAAIDWWNGKRDSLHLDAPP